jgi:ferredoxin/flavodoxin---NADP+ reductase
MNPSWNEHVHAHDPFEPGPVTVVERRPLAPNIQLLTVHAPSVAAKIKPGNFVIVRADEYGERTPLTVADWNREAGTVSCVFMTVGTSTYKLAKLKKGDVVPTFAGPLGKPFEIETFGTVLLIGGCYGIGIIYPLARALKEKGNRVISLIEGRSSFLLYWQDRLEAVSDQVVYATKDLSVGDRRDAADVVEEMIKAGEPVQRIFANGCTFLMYHISQMTRPYGIKTIVALNPIMIDGTGMCGACRVSIGGETKFACVDGPDFDGHLVDWDLLLARRKAYLGPEATSVEK